MIQKTVFYAGLALIILGIVLAYIKYGEKQGINVFLAVVAGYSLRGLAEKLEK